MCIFLPSYFFIIFVACDSCPCLFALSVTLFPLRPSTKLLRGDRLLSRATTRLQYRLCDFSFIFTSASISFLYPFFFFVRGPIRWVWQGAILSDCDPPDDRSWFTRWHFMLIIVYVFFVVVVFRPWLNAAFYPALFLTSFFFSSLISYLATVQYFLSFHCFFLSYPLSFTLFTILLFFLLSVLFSLLPNTLCPHYLLPSFMKFCPLTFTLFTLSHFSSLISFLSPAQYYFYFYYLPLSFSFHHTSLFFSFKFISLFSSAFFVLIIYCLPWLNPILCFSVFYHLSFLYSFSSFSSSAQYSFIYVFIVFFNIILSFIFPSFQYLSLLPSSSSFFTLAQHSLSSLSL